MMSIPCFGMIKFNSQEIVMNEPCVQLKSIVACAVALLSLNIVEEASASVPHHSVNDKPGKMTSSQNGCPKSCSQLKKTNNQNVEKIKYRVIDFTQSPSGVWDMEWKNLQDKEAWMSVPSEKKVDLLNNLFKKVLQQYRIINILWNVVIIFLIMLDMETHPSLSRFERIYKKKQTIHLHKKLNRKKSHLWNKRALR